MNSAYLQPKPTLPWIRLWTYKFSVICLHDKTVSNVCNVRCTVCGNLTVPRAEVCWLCRYRKTPHLEGLFSKERAIRIQAQEVLGRRDTEYSTNLEHSHFYSYSCINFILGSCNTGIGKQFQHIFDICEKKAVCKDYAKDAKTKDIYNLINAN